MTTNESTAPQCRRKTFFRRLHSFGEAEGKTIAKQSSDVFTQKIPVRKISEPTRNGQYFENGSSERIRKISKPSLTILQSPQISNGLFNWYSRLSTNVKKNLHSPKVFRRFLVSVYDMFIPSISHCFLILFFFAVACRGPIPRKSKYIRSR